MMRNASAITLTAGMVVVMDFTTGGVTLVNTTTDLGSRLVCGVVLESITVGNYGAVMIEGYTTLLKVNGATDIAIGDFIATSGAAGIGRKANAGETAIAIAMEAYAGDDDNGVINAYVIPPRVV